MSDEARTVQMFIIKPGATAVDGEFTFDMQPRANAARTVRFALEAKDAELLHAALDAYLKSLQK